MPTKRLRIIAGPNGSGKSSVYARMHDLVHLGHYLNPDDIGLAFRQKGWIGLGDFGLSCSPDALSHYLREERSFVRKAEAAGERVSLHLFGSHLEVGLQERVDYNAALAAAFLRGQMIESGQSFTFESVLSDARKLEEIQAAKDRGYRIYLYFVCTADPDINVDRVANRVAKGGHPVPENLIRKRYLGTLSNLLPAFLLCDRAYLFDNSGEQMELVLEADGQEWQMHLETAPTWLIDHLLVPLGNNPTG